MLFLFCHSYQFYKQYFFLLSFLSILQTIFFSSVITINSTKVFHNYFLFYAVFGIIWHFCCEVTTVEKKLIYLTINITFKSSPITSLVSPILFCFYFKTFLTYLPPLANSGKLQGKD